MAWPAQLGSLGIQYTIVWVGACNKAHPSSTQPACQQQPVSLAAPQGAAWSAGNLGSTDPRQFQYALHEADSFPRVSCGAVVPLCRSAFVTLSRHFQYARRESDSAGELSGRLAAAQRLIVLLCCCQGLAPLNPSTIQAVPPAPHAANDQPLHLSPFDRPQVDPPAGCQWESSWQVDHGPATDQDGWAYAPGAWAGRVWPAALPGCTACRLAACNLHLARNVLQVQVQLQPELVPIPCSASLSCIHSPALFRLQEPPLPAARWGAQAGPCRFRAAPPLGAAAAAGRPPTLPRRSRCSNGCGQGPGRCCGSGAAHHRGPSWQA